MAALKASQIGALTIDQLSGFGTAQLVAWNTSQLGALTNAQIGYLSTAQINGLSTDQIAGLKSSQLISFSNSQLVALSTAQVTALATTGLSALSVSQADAFTATQVAAMTTAQTMALNASSVNYATPLVLDLDGNGVQTLGIAAGVQFDIRAEGSKVATGWVAPSDGLLALDRNGDGVIDDASELFGSATALPDGSKAANGYAALAALDSNGDGKIDASDAAYSQLRVWVDANSDGISEAGELKTLAQLDIASISTRADNTLGQQNGNLVGMTSSYTSTDGSQHDTADVWFLAQKSAATSGATLQQQVSSLSSAIGSHAAAAPAAQTQQLTLDPAAATPAQALSSALRQYHAAQGLQGMSAALDSQHPRDPQHSQAGWFSVPNR